jgi:hypothetical protein
MGTAHGAEELGLCPHGLACPGRSLGPLHRVLPRVWPYLAKNQKWSGRQKYHEKPITYLVNFSLCLQYPDTRSIAYSRRGTAVYTAVVASTHAIERTARTSPSGDQRPWGVSFAAVLASRRVSRARVVVPPGG